MRRLPDSLASMGLPRIVDNVSGEGSRTVGFFGCWLTVLLGVLGVQFCLLTMFGVELNPITPLFFGILFSFVSCVPFFCPRKRVERIVFLCIFLFFVVTVALFSRVVVYSLNSFLNVCIDRINQNSIVKFANFDLSVLNRRILYMSLPYTTTYSVALAFIAALFSQLFAFFTFSARLPAIPVVLSAAVLGSGLFCLLLPGPIPFLLLISFCLAALFGKSGRSAQPVAALERVNRKKVRVDSKSAKAKKEKNAMRSPAGTAAFYMTVFLLVGSLLSALLIPQNLHFNDKQFAKWSEQLGHYLFGEGTGFGSFGGVGNGSLQNLESLRFTGQEVFTVRGNPPTDLYLRARASAAYRKNQWGAEEQPLPPFEQGYASTVEAYFDDRLGGTFGNPEDYGFFPGSYTIDPLDSMPRLEPPLLVYPSDYSLNFSGNSSDENLFIYTVPKMGNQADRFRSSQQEFLSWAQQAAEEAAARGERLYFMDWYVLEDAPGTYDGAEYFGKASIPGVDGVEDETGFYAELRTLAQEILDEYGLGNAADIGKEDYYAVASAFASYLSTHYSYTLEPGGPASRNDDVVEYFLFENRKGFCVHFASAMTLLLRTIDVPTRYAEGYAVSSSQFSDGKATALDRNAHAWPEVFIEGIGWLPFEPTPGGGALADHDPPSSQPQPSSSESPSSTSSAQSSSQAAASSSQPSSSSSSNPQGPGTAGNEPGTAGLLAVYLAAAVVLLVLGMILRRQLLIKKRLRSFDTEALGASAAIGNLYAYLCTLLGTWKLARGADEPFSAFAQRVRQHPVARETGVPFGELFAAVLRARFDSAPCGEQEYRLVLDGVEKIAAALADASPLYKRFYYRYLRCIL